MGDVKEVYKAKVTMRALAGCNNGMSVRGKARRRHC
ncbi:hypothetical protein MUK42_35638 [Musa troglodytarum]|uniref:Uncharacterized protein n=1 Tax=Musa troglodytarum TaxID=320322 RepID=A0A9E7KUE3_9LILI|nr:hypothetical protein MUK42_35638 [Musa troglodytarum]